MESLKARYDAAVKCLESLYESLKIADDPQFKCVYEQLRDSIIQRFEYTIDTFWKFLREYLEKVSAITFVTVSPRQVLRSALQAGILTQKEFDLFINMVMDRNLTSHTYNEELAEAVKNA